MQGAYLTFTGLSHLLFAWPASANDSRASADAAPVVLHTIETGFVFVDGEYLETPYEVTLSEDGESVLINDHLVASAAGERVSEGPRGRRGGGRRGVGGPNGGRGKGPDGPNWRSRFDPSRIVRDILEGEAGSIVAMTGQPPVYLQYSQTVALLKLLKNFDRSAAGFEENLSDLPSESAQKWDSWMSAFVPTEGYQRRVDEFMKAIEENLATHAGTAAAIRRYDHLAYPLTVLGMLVGVIAFGHLLVSLPSRAEMRGDEGVTSEIVRATVISLGLIVALSSLDLIWTILASQAGQMRELNPLASRLISDPEALIGFKALATLTGCGLLFALRHHGRAQLASWWMCLICTMLTFRWLMFNSMFIA